MKQPKKYKTLESPDVNARDNPAPKRRLESPDVNARDNPARTTKRKKLPVGIEIEVGWVA